MTRKSLVSLLNLLSPSSYEHLYLKTYYCNPHIPSPKLNNLLYYLPIPLLFLTLSQVNYIEKHSPDKMSCHQFIHPFA